MNATLIDHNEPQRASGPRVQQVRLRRWRKPFKRPTAASTPISNHHVQHQKKKEKKEKKKNTEANKPPLDDNLSSFPGFPALAKGGNER
jgi:hypothetical protein